MWAYLTRVGPHFISDNVNLKRWAMMVYYEFNERS